MRRITTIELKKITRDKLREIGTMHHSFDDVINQLIQDNDEVNKYIENYIKGAKGKCICKVVLGRAIVANHHFNCDNKCIKCDIERPIITSNTSGKTVIDIE